MIAYYKQPPTICHCSATVCTCAARCEIGLNETTVTMSTTNDNRQRIELEVLNRHGRRRKAALMKRNGRR